MAQVWQGLMEAVRWGPAAEACSLGTALAQSTLATDSSRVVLVYCNPLPVCN